MVVDFYLVIKVLIPCVEQQQRLLQQIEFFIDMQAEEQKAALEDTLPTVEQYCRRRMGTSAVGVCLALTEYYALCNIEL